MNYKVIQTGSDGNAVVLDDIILIDCGVSYRQLKEYYKKLQVVLLTHIHADHFKKSTIKRLAKERPTLRFGAGPHLVENLIKAGVKRKNIDIIELNETYDYGLFTVKPIELFHDVENYGYRIYKDNKKALYITDTHKLDGIEAKNYDLYLIEANYEEEKLKAKIKEKKEKGEFTYEDRVQYSHLSKEETDQFLLKNMGDKSKAEYLHMSKNYEN